MHHAGEKLVAFSCQKASNSGVETDSILMEEDSGRIFEHVVEQASRFKADLIVVGSHGRRCIGRVLLGSDAEQIARHATIPELVVRAQVAQYSS